MNLLSLIQVIAVFFSKRLLYTHTCGMMTQSQKHSPPPVCERRREEHRTALRFMSLQLCLFLTTSFNGVHGGSSNTSQGRQSGRELYLLQNWTHNDTMKCYCVNNHKDVLIFFFETRTSRTCHQHEDSVSFNCSELQISQSVHGFCSQKEYSQTRGRGRMHLSHL